MLAFWCDSLSGACKILLICLCCQEGSSILSIFFENSAASRILRIFWRRKLSNRNNNWFGNRIWEKKRFFFQKSSKISILNCSEYGLSFFWVGANFARGGGGHRSKVETAWRNTHPNLVLSPIGAPTMT